MLMTWGCEGGYVIIDHPFVGGSEQDLSNFNLFIFSKKVYASAEFVFLIMEWKLPSFKNDQFW